VCTKCDIYVFITSHASSVYHHNGFKLVDIMVFISCSDTVMFLSCESKLVGNLRAVSYVPNIASVCGVSLRFSLTFIS
jgi:hypothetical protein